MKNLRLVISLFLVAIIAASCGTSNQVVSNSIIQKRKHTKGFHVNLKSEKYRKVDHYDPVKVSENQNRPPFEGIAIRNSETRILRTNNVGPVWKDAMRKKSQEKNKIASLSYARRNLAETSSKSETAQMQSSHSLVQSENTLLGQEVEIIAEDEPSDQKAKSNASQAAKYAFIFGLFGGLLSLALLQSFLVGLPLLFITGSAAVILGFIGFYDVVSKDKKGLAQAIVGLLLGAYQLILAFALLQFF